MPEINTPCDTRNAIRQRGWKSFLDLAETEACNYCTVAANRDRPTFSKLGSTKMKVFFLNGETTTSKRTGLHGGRMDYRCLSGKDSLDTNRTRGD